MAVFMAITAQHASAAWHEQFPGRGVQTHYVRLTGYGGDNAVNRNDLLIAHTGCAERNRFLRKPVEPLSPDDIPAIPRPIDVEIYYTANRTLTVTHGQTYRIEFDTCALTIFEHHMLRLVSGIGRCDIDLLKKEARGECDTDSHRRAPALVRGVASQPSAIDVSKLPPHLRAQIQARLDQLNQVPKATSNTNPSTTRNTKTIAGHECEIVRLTVNSGEKCIANPSSSFVIPASPFNAISPGLLLETKNYLMTLLAQQVSLHMEVPEAVFNVPQGVTIRFSKRPGQ
jgi:hypothetical protein